MPVPNPEKAAADTMPHNEGAWTDADRQMLVGAAYAFSSEEGLTETEKRIRASVHVERVLAEAGLMQRLGSTFNKLADRLQGRTAMPEPEEASGTAAAYGALLEALGEDMDSRLAEINAALDRLAA